MTGNEEGRRAYYERIPLGIQLHCRERIYEEWFQRFLQSILFLKQDCSGSGARILAIIFSPEGIRVVKDTTQNI